MNDLCELHVSNNISCILYLPICIYVNYMNDYGYFVSFMYMFNFIINMMMRTKFWFWVFYLFYVYV